jgi:hypothetical protein
MAQRTADAWFDAIGVALGRVTPDDARNQALRVSATMI